MDKAKEIWDGVVKNQKLLDQCEHHMFSKDLTPDQSFLKRWECVNCGGEVSNSDKYWYELGQKHK